MIARICHRTWPCGCLLSSCVISTGLGQRGPELGKERLVLFPSWLHPLHALPTAGPAETKAVVPSQNAAVVKHLPVPRLATICAARTGFCSRLECPMPTGSHQGSCRQHLGASLACQLHSRPKLSPGKQTSRRPARTWKALLSPVANLSPSAARPL